AAGRVDRLSTAKAVGVGDHFKAPPTPDPAPPLSGGRGEESAGQTTDLAARIAAFKASHARLACLCASDKVYATEAVEAARALKAAGAIVHLAGRPGELEASLRQAGVETCIFMGCDVVATLQAAHDILERT
ncbi:MAG: hypothetical protein ACR2K5_14950, partial [Pseudolabrys sp.]